MKLIENEHVGRITKEPPSKVMSPDLAPLRVSVWCTIYAIMLRGEGKGRKEKKK